MEPVLHAATLVSAAAVSALFSAIWEGAVVAVCIALCLRTIPRLSAAFRSLIWLAVFFFLILLNIGPSFSGRPGSAGPVHAIHLGLGWSAAIAALWAMLSLLRGAQLILSAIRLSRMANRATPLAHDPALLATIEGGRAATLCTSVEVERPSVFGFFRPRILIPPALIEKLSASEMRQVVLHEMEHLRRRDDWTNLLQKAALVLFPLNPALLWVERRLCAERELACDDRVLRSIAAPKAYAICLTRLAEFSMLQRSLSLVLGAWERQSELVRRVDRLLRRPTESMGARQAQFVTASLILGVLGGVIALARTPQFISFAPSAKPALQAHASFQAPAAQPAALRDVNFSQSNPRESAGTQAQIHLVKAVMPERPLQSACKARPARSNAAIARRSLRRLFAENPQRFVDSPREFVDSPWEFVVLTEWTDTGAPPRVVFAVLPVRPADRESRFAAVATPNGWLIVQI
jgi:beta-lactamase regulating signal transducer with metallopeptidase domain